MTGVPVRLLSPEGLTVQEMMVPCFEDRIEAVIPRGLKATMVDTDESLPINVAFRRIRYRYERTDGGGWHIYRQELDLGPA